MNTHPHYYPIFIKGDGFHVLVVGGGTVAEGKILSLCAAGAQVTVVSLEITPAIAGLVKSGTIVCIRERYHSTHIRSVHLVIGATNDNDVNSQIARDAKNKGIFVNIVDDPANCSVIMPSIMKKGPLTVEIEESIPDAYGILIDELSILRPRIRKLPFENRKEFWSSVTSLNIGDMPKGDATMRHFVQELLGKHENKDAAHSFISDLSERASLVTKTQLGRVYLVGAGPGDPLLITLRGKQCLEQADVVVYDYLADQALLDFAPSAAEKIFVGKSASRHTKEQEEINQLIVARSLAGKTVVRLKGGDPLIFGRGGEECEALRAHGITFEIVPGITSGVGALAYAGIPLTHRSLASSVAFVTGHVMSGPRAPINWEHLARGVDTLVFYMGVANAANISDELIKYGRPTAAPVALIEWGTKPNQRTVITTLGLLAETCKKEQVRPPALIVIGEVVRLRERLQWFEKTLAISPSIPSHE